MSNPTHSETTVATTRVMSRALVPDGRLRTEWLTLKGRGRRGGVMQHERYLLDGAAREIERPMSGRESGGTGDDCLTANRNTGHDEETLSVRRRLASTNADRRAGNGTALVVVDRSVNRCRTRESPRRNAHEACSRRSCRARRRCRAQARVEVTPGERRDMRPSR